MPKFVARVAHRLGIADQLKYLRIRANRTRYRDYLDTRQMQMLFAFVLSKHSNCIDVGAHTGETLRQILRYAPGGQHFAFEPIPELFERLRGDFPSVVVRREALSASNGNATFKHVRNAPAFSGLLLRSYPIAPKIESIIVPVARLDDILPSDYQPDLIKIDVEGAEHLVLAGAQGVIDRYRPVIVFEHGLGGEARPADIHDFFERVDFRIFDLDGNGPYDKTAFLNEHQLNERWNWVAHP